MTEADPPANASDPSPPRPTVQNLITAYRAARICQRATLQAERRAERAAIGFGPGMVISFRQLGIESAADLAASDPAALRTALGDVTRLINVNDWIASAQKAIAA